jgi:hypothetical protein
MKPTMQGFRGRRTVVHSMLLLMLLGVGMTGGCRRSPNAPTAEMQKQWEQGPSATPPPQAAEAMRKAMQQGQPRR